MLASRNIDRTPVSVFIPVTSWMSNQGVSATPAQTSLVSDTEILEVGTTGFGVLKCDTNGDGVRTVFPLPRNIDTDQSIAFRVYWLSDSVTTTDSVTWTVKYKPLTVNSSALAAPDTALSTAIAADTVPTSTAGTVNTTELGYLDMNATAKASYATGNVVFALEVLKSASSGFSGKHIYFVGLELAYIPRIGTDHGGAVSTAKSSYFSS
jgi:PPE-repeat protein